MPSKLTPGLNVVTEVTNDEPYFVILQLVVGHCRELFAQILPHTLHLSSSVINGRTLRSMASRARNIRERTVPIGQSMAWAMSS